MVMSLFRIFGTPKQGQVNRGWDDIRNAKPVTGKFVETFFFCACSLGGGGKQSWVAL
jgi:hypothetical protein